MKYKTTKREVMNGYRHIYKVNYCDLQTTLKCCGPVAYTCGRDGWNADIYDLGGGVAIVTGYRPFGNIPMTYDQAQEIEKAAKAILSKYNDYKTQRAHLDALIADTFKMEF